MGTGNPELAEQLPSWPPDRRYPAPLQQLGDDPPAPPEPSHPISRESAMMPMKRIVTRSADGPQALNEERSLP